MLTERRKPERSGGQSSRGECAANSRATPFDMLVCLKDEFEIQLLAAACGRRRDLAPAGSLHRSSFQECVRGPAQGCAELLRGAYRR